MQGFAPVTDPLNQCYEQIADSPRIAVQACLQSKLDRADEVMNQSLMDNEAELKKNCLFCNNTSDCFAKKITR